MTNQTPAQELRDAALTITEGGEALTREVNQPLADLLEFLSGHIEYDATRGRSGTMTEEYALKVARAITGH